jgi:hypothetical protein
MKPAVMRPGRPGCVYGPSWVATANPSLVPCATVQFDYGHSRWFSPGHWVQVDGHSGQVEMTFDYWTS